MMCFAVYGDFLAPLTPNVWGTLGACLAGLVSAILLAWKAYLVFRPPGVKAHAEVGDVVLRLAAGFTEPGDPTYFLDFSAGVSPIGGFI